MKEYEFVTDYEINKIKLIIKDDETSNKEKIEKIIEIMEEFGGLIFWANASG